MDMLVKNSGPLTHSKMMDFIEANIPSFRSYSEKDRELMIERVKEYLKIKGVFGQDF